MKFGFQQPSHTFSNSRNVFQQLKQVAVEAEDQGYDSFWIMDHLVQIAHAGKISEPILEPYAALAGLAACTSKIKLGPLCTCNTLRNPGLLAKMGATLDHASNGRFWLGIGAGWFEEEARMYGFNFPDDATRLEMLEETLQIVRNAWTKKKTTFRGKYYKVTNLILEPKPVQKPRPPILVGGEGKKITLRLAAKYGDACNFFSKGTRLAELLDALKEHCRQVKRPYSSILKTKLATVGFGRDKDDALKRILPYKPKDMSINSFVGSSILGEPGRIIREIEELKEIGIQYLIINFRGRYNPQDKRDFAKEIMSTF